MHHPIPKPLKGNYPFAILHSVRNDGVPAAIELARKLSEEEMSHDEAVEYVSACLRTKGQPQILDLLEEEVDRKKKPADEMEFS